MAEQKEGQETYFEKLENEHQEVLDNYGIIPSQLPIRLRTDFISLNGDIEKLKNDPENESLFFTVQGKITKLADKIQEHLEQEQVD